MPYDRLMTTPPSLPSELWNRTPHEVQDYILALEARVAALEAIVQELMERLQQDSRTSSRPPSSDPPERQRPRRQPSGRRRGGQPGHPGQTRMLLPVEDVDVVLPLKPEQCARCQQPLTGNDPQPQRHQVLEIPPLKPVVTEYQLHRLVCLVCGDSTRASWPDGVTMRAYSPRVQAITALCTGAYRLSKRTTQQLLEDLFGVTMSLGTGLSMGSKQLVRLCWNYPGLIKKLLLSGTQLPNCVSGVALEHIGVQLQYLFASGVRFPGHAKPAAGAGPLVGAEH